MLGKNVLRQVFEKITTGGRLRVVFWDGTQEEFGRDEPLVGTLTLRDPGIIAALAQEVELGFAESYINGQIEFDGKIHDLILLAIQNKITTGSQSQRLLGGFLRGLTKATTVKEQKADIHHHYDLGNAFFRLFLDPTMTYSCAYFRTPQDSLEAAQRQKVSHTLKKLNLHTGERLLDIGSGWGELILTAAKIYGVTAHGITMSDEQLKETQRRITAEGLEDRVSVSLEDYREHAQAGHTYDKIASVGMFEHVGRPNLPIFLDAIRQMLVPGGLLLLHFITQLFEHRGGTFTVKYIFPGGYIPSVRETLALLPERDLRLLDAENLRYHYALTLDRWAENFDAHLDQVRTIFAERERLGERWGGAIEAEKFIRIWRLYLEGSCANFRGGNLELHQFLFSKGTTNALPLTREAWYTDDKTRQ